MRVGRDPKKVVTSLFRSAPAVFRPRQSWPSLCPRSRAYSPYYPRDHRGRNSGSTRTHARTAGQRKHAYRYKRAWAFAPSSPRRVLHTALLVRSRGGLLTLAHRPQSHAGRAATTATRVRRGARVSRIGVKCIRVRNIRTRIYHIIYSCVVVVIGRARAREVHARRTTANAYIFEVRRTLSAAAYHPIPRTVL